MRQGMRMGGMGGVGFTPLTKVVLMVLVGLYVLQQLAESWLDLPITRLFAWWPFGLGFQPWQPFTAFFLNGEVMRAFFDWLFLFFLLPPIEQMFGRRELARAAISTMLGSILIGLLLVGVGAVTIQRPWYGIEPLLAALLVLFGLSRPNAQILLFFVLPVKAAWVAWGSGLLCGLYLLSGRDLASAMWASGWVCGYLWINGGLSKGLKKFLLKWKHRRVQRRLQTFDVIDGGRDTSTKGRGWGRPTDDDIVH